MTDDEQVRTRRAADGRLGGRVVLVTGGGRGIGAAISRRVAAEGAAVGVTWFRDEVSAKETAASIEDAGGRCVTVRAVLSEPQAPREAVRVVERELGSVDTVVANAATGMFKPLREMRSRHLDWALQANALSLHRLCQAARSARAVVALTSLGATRAHAGYGSVGVSKAALEAMVRYLALELAPHTRVNAISPGAVGTDAVRRLFPNAEEMLRWCRDGTPMGRLVVPEDVAALAAFLVSDDAAMLTGQTITLDGGFSNRTWWDLPS
jgi:enoyl-[acyl-carrier protein] reductase III